MKIRRNLQPTPQQAAAVHRDDDVTPAGSDLNNNRADQVETNDFELDLDDECYYSDEDRMEILRKILVEFRDYVDHFGGAQSHIEGDILHVDDEGRAREIHLQNELQSDVAGKGRVHLVLGSVTSEARRKFDAAGNPWFSWADHACADELDELALALKDYLNRYGIQFARN